MATKVKPLNYCPTAQQWSAEMVGDSPAPRWLAHLETCSACQHKLEEIAASPELWSEARETLADRPVDLHHITESIVPLSMDPSRNLLGDPLCEYEISQLQRLLPPVSEESKQGNGHVLSYPPCQPIARIGRYEMEQLIGRGGMGLVFRAWDTQLHRVVAVKTLSMSLWSLPAARERFIREGRAAAMLNHPNIVPMYDVINDPPVPALVMQYIAGPTLDEWITMHGPLPWSQALRIALQLADALCAAHAEGLVHRDIKPGNVLLEADGTRALLTDFGLVRVMDDVTLTQSGLLAGTPHFMSPEQAKGDDTDGRSDLFSLGSLVYYCISGQTPFRGRESMSVLNSLCHSPHEPLIRVNSQVPREVSSLIDRLLSKQPSDRPASSQLVREELRKLLASEQRLVVRPPKNGRPRRRLVVAVGLLAVIAMLPLPWIMSSVFSPKTIRPNRTFTSAADRLDLNEYSQDNMMASDKPPEYGLAAPGASEIGRSSPEVQPTAPKFDLPQATELDDLMGELQRFEKEVAAFDGRSPSQVAGGTSLTEQMWRASQEASRQANSLGPMSDPKQRK